MNPIAKNIWRYSLVLLLQVLVFKQLNIAGGAFNYVQVLIYPLFILLLPLNISKSWLILLGFLLGISVDMFYDSPGVHASASVLTAFIRPSILQLLEPRGGYKVNAHPTSAEFGTAWFIRYSSLLLGIHLLTYFIAEAFQWSQMLMIMLKTIVSFFSSMIVISLYMVIFNPKE